MALYRTGDGTQISGSVGGLTFSRNRYGSYKRARTKPVNPNTPGQNTVRANFAAGSSNWRSLADSQRQNWAVYAAGTPRLNRLGETIILSPNAWYSGARALRSQVDPTNLALVDTAPTTPGMADILDISLAATLNPSTDMTHPNTIGVDWTIVSGLGDLETSGGCQLQWSGIQSNGKSFFNGPWITIATLPYDTTPFVISWYGVPAVVTGGQICWVRTRQMWADNRYSTTFQCLLVA